MIYHWQVPPALYISTDWICASGVVGVGIGVPDTYLGQICSYCDISDVQAVPLGELLRIRYLGVGAQGPLLHGPCSWEIESGEIAEIASRPSCDNQPALPWERSCNLYCYPCACKIHFLRLVVIVTFGNATAFSLRLCVRDTHVGILPEELLPCIQMEMLDGLGDVVKNQLFGSTWDKKNNCNMKRGTGWY